MGTYNNFQGLIQRFNISLLETLVLVGIAYESSWIKLVDLIKLFIVPSLLSKLNDKVTFLIRFELARLTYHSSQILGSRWHLMGLIMSGGNYTIFFMTLGLLLLPWKYIVFKYHIFCVIQKASLTWFQQLLWSMRTEFPCMWLAHTSPPFVLCKGNVRVQNYMFSILQTLHWNVEGNTLILAWS